VYKPGSSTTTACLTIQDFISTALDEGKIALMYSIDLTSAFDLIRPSLLVKAMLNSGIDKKLIQVILNFLTNRTGFVDFKGQNSYVSKIPIGCVQGSVLGPVLFNIYVNQLQTVVGEDVLCVSYADDSYVAVSCPVNETNFFLNKLSDIASRHINWLQSIGMICNASKSDFVAFGHQGLPLSLNINGSVIESKDQIKILGITFTSNLKWNRHVNLVISKCNRMSYMLRFLRLHLNAEQHRRVIFSHFLSVLLYCSSVWAGCVSYQDNRRLNTLIYKVIRLNCRDFSRILSNNAICNKTRIRSFNSARIVFDALMLHSLCTNPTNTLLTIRLMQNSVSFSRYPNKLAFHDLSRKRIGKNSFANRAKYISKLIPYEWVTISFKTFRQLIRSTVPYHMP